MQYDTFAVSGVSFIISVHKNTYQLTFIMKLKTLRILCIIKVIRTERVVSSVVQGIPSAGPYMIPGQAQLYPQGPPPTYDQALAHPAIMGQPVSSTSSSATKANAK